MYADKLDRMSHPPEDTIFGVDADILKRTMEICPCGLCLEDDGDWYDCGREIGQRYAAALLKDTITEWLVGKGYVVLTCDEWTQVGIFVEHSFSGNPFKPIVTDRHTLTALCEAAVKVEAKG